MKTLNNMMIILSTISWSANAQRGKKNNKEECPAPIGQFIDFPRSVVIPKIVDQKVATLSIQENSYYGSSTCSILEDTRDSVFDNFGVEEHYRGPSRRTKDCIIRLTSSNFAQDRVDLTILLIVQLVPGLPTRCDSPISAKATIRVEFCRLGNSGCYSSTIVEETQVLAGKNKDLAGINEAKREDSENYTRSLLDNNATLIVAIGLIVTLVAVFLAIALSYFWCPSLCCCFTNCWCNRRKKEFDTLKILTVRDEDGRVIKDAKTAEVWKTKENRFKSYDIIDNKSGDNIKKIKTRYNKLREERDAEDINEGLARRQQGPEYAEEGLARRHREANLRPDRGGGSRMLMLRNEPHSRDGRQSSFSRITVLEELNPSALSPYHQRSVSEAGRLFRVVEKDVIEQIESHYPRREDPRYRRAPTNFELYRVNQNDSSRSNSLNYSRHYASDDSSRSYDRPDIEVTRGRRLPADRVIIRNPQGASNVARDREMPEPQGGFNIARDREMPEGRRPGDGAEINVLRLERDEGDVAERRKHGEVGHGGRSKRRGRRHGGERGTQTEPSAEEDSSLASTKSTSVHINFSAKSESDDLDKSKPDMKENIMAEIKKRAEGFEDRNRTPSPAADQAKDFLEQARKHRQNEN